MIRLLAVTEFFNEADNIRAFVGNIASPSQGIKPKVWLLIDDGSTDKSAEVFVEVCQAHQIPYRLEQMPTKSQPDANKKGIAFQQSVLSDSEWLDEFDYLIKLDVDTFLSPGYIERALEIMEEDPTIGCFAGQIVGEAPRTIPCGTGKLVRVSVLRLTCKKYWDLDPDTLWNIVAHLNQYRLVIGDRSFLMWTTKPSKLFQAEGRYKMGQRMAYVRCNTFLVFLRYLKSLKNRTHSWQFLKGYLREWLRLRDRWRSNDDDVQYFYSLKHLWNTFRGKIQKP